MTTHSQTTALLEQTTDLLTNGLTTQAGEKNANLLQRWIDTLNQSENTKELADKLAELHKAVSAPKPAAATVQGLLTGIADWLDEFSAEVGPEGELPSQLQGLASALRSAGDQLT